jgi:hypothetical protein
VCFGHAWTRDIVRDDGARARVRGGAIHKSSIQSYLLRHPHIGGATRRDCAVITTCPSSPPR